MADLTAADPVAVVLTWLRAHPRITEEFGGPAHVSGLYEAPWPHLRVSPGPSGGIDSAWWTAQSEVTLEVVDHPGNTVGQAGLWRLATAALIVAGQVVERDVTAFEPVVSVAAPSGTVAWQPLQTGQGRWAVGLAVQLHPPLT